MVPINPNLLALLPKSPPHLADAHVPPELEAEGGVLRTTDEYVDALINYKIRRLVRKHALAASALAGTGASGAALLGLLLQALARLSRAGPGRTTTSAPPDRPPLKARPPGASEEEEAARRSSAPSGGGGRGGRGGWAPSRSTGWDG